MTPLDAFREYLRLAVQLSQSPNLADDCDMIVKIFAMYAMLTTKSQKVAQAVGQEFQSLEKANKKDNRIRQLNAFRAYLQGLCALSEVIVRHGADSDEAITTKSCLKVIWHRMCGLSCKVCSRVEEELNRLEAMK